jgi:hypothetical protein
MMPADRRYLIRPPEKSWRGGKYVCFRFNGGDWIPDDGQPDLAFVVNDSGWPYAYGAEWPRYFMRHTHQNNLAQEQAMKECVRLYGVANGVRVKPLPEKQRGERDGC